MLARKDRETLKRKKIKSPDIKKMYSLKIGKTTYYFYDKKKLEKFKEKLKDEKHDL